MRTLPFFSFEFEKKKTDKPYRFHNCVVQIRSEEHTSELQSRSDLVCRLLLEKKNDRQGAVEGAGRRPDRIAPLDARHGPAQRITRYQRFIALHVENQLKVSKGFVGNDFCDALGAGLVVR